VVPEASASDVSTEDLDACRTGSEKEILTFDRLDDDKSTSFGA